MKYALKILLLQTTLILLLVGCKGKTVNSASDSASGQDFENKDMSLSDEEICNALHEASEFAWEWFWDSDRNHIDENDTYIGTYENMDGWEYKRVNYGGIHSVEDVLELTKHYFTEAIAEELVSYKQWHEDGDNVYVSEPDGIGGVESDRFDIKIVKENEMKYTITIYEYFFDELWCEPYNIHLEYINGYWVFDKVLYRMGEPVEINILSQDAIDEENTTEEWKEVYIDYIVENSAENVSAENLSPETYKLVNIDDDEIPELYINFGSTWKGDCLCSYQDGSLICQSMWNCGFSYLEGQNIFMDSGGNMDLYYNKIYCIEDGKFELLYKGEYGAEDNVNVQYDLNGNPIYNYLWNGTKVSSELEYQNLLNEVYDSTKASSPFDGAQLDSNTWRYVGNGLCNYTEIIEYIKKY